MSSRLSRSSRSRRPSSSFNQSQRYLGGLRSGSPTGSLTSHRRLGSRYTPSSRYYGDDEESTIGLSSRRASYRHYGEEESTNPGVGLSSTRASHRRYNYGDEDLTNPGVGLSSTRASHRRYNYGDEDLADPGIGLSSTRPSHRRYNYGDDGSEGDATVRDYGGRTSRKASRAYEDTMTLPFRSRNDRGFGLGIPRTARRASEAGSHYMTGEESRNYRAANYTKAMDWDDGYGGAYERPFGSSGDSYGYDGFGDDDLGDYT